MLQKRCFSSKGQGKLTGRRNRRRWGANALLPLFSLERVSGWQDITIPDAGWVRWTLRFPEVIQWQRCRTDGHPLRVISQKTEFTLDFPIYQPVGLGRLLGTTTAVYMLPLPELRSNIPELIIYTDHSPHAQQQIHPSNSGVQSHSR